MIHRSQHTLKFMSLESDSFTILYGIYTFNMFNMPRPYKRLKISFW